MRHLCSRDVLRGTAMMFEGVSMRVARVFDRHVQGGSEVSKRQGVRDCKGVRETRYEGVARMLEGCVQGTPSACEGVRRPVREARCEGGLCVHWTRFEGQRVYRGKAGVFERRGTRRGYGCERGEERGDVDVREARSEAAVFERLGLKGGSEACRVRRCKNVQGYVQGGVSKRLGVYKGQCEGLCETYEACQHMGEGLCAAYTRDRGSLGL